MELRTVFFPTNPGPGLLNETRLEAAAKWAGVGFTALTAVLAFFGIKEGLLDRVLRADATSALLVFCLLGLGALCSLLAPALEPDLRIRATWGALAVISLGCLTWWRFPDFGDDPAMGTLSWALFGAGCVVALALWKVPLSLVAAVLVVGVASVSFGLYGTAKLSLRSKTFPDTPRITASFDGEDQQSVKVGVLASKKENQQVVVTLRGVAGETAEQAVGAVIGQARLPADATGDINTTLVFPVDRADWHALTIDYCTDAGNDPPVCGPVSARLPGLRGRGPTSVEATVGPGRDGGVSAAASARRMPPGSVLRVSLSRIRTGRDQPLAFASLAASATGAAGWAFASAGGEPGDRFVVRYRRCTGPDRGCDAVAREAASYVVLRP